MTCLFCDATWAREYDSDLGWHHFHGGERIKCLKADPPPVPEVVEPVGWGITLFGWALELILLPFSLIGMFASMIGMMVSGVISVVLFFAVVVWIARACGVDLGEPPQ